MRIARKVMAVSELAWDLDNDPRAEPSSVRPSPTFPPQSFLPESDVKPVVEPPPIPIPRPQPPRPAAVPRVRVNAPTNPVFEGSMTKRITTIDKRLLAMARGEIDPEPITARSPDATPTKPVPPRFASAAQFPAVEPPKASVATLDDPFGGLIPVNDDGEAIEVEEAWLEDAVEPSPFSMRR